MMEPPPLSRRSSKSGEPYTCSTRQPLLPPLRLPPLVVVAAASAPAVVPRLAGSMRSSRSNTCEGKTLNVSV